MPISQELAVMQKVHVNDHDSELPIERADQNKRVWRKDFFHIK